MARHRSFVPESPIEGTLEGRVALSSFFGSVGDWFSSEYKNVKEDVGITHRPKSNSSSTETNNSLLKTVDSGKTIAVSPFHGTHVAKVK
jgi:hypothetical protein